MPKQIEEKDMLRNIVSFRCTDKELQKILGQQLKSETVNDCVRRLVLRKKTHKMK